LDLGIIVIFNSGSEFSRYHPATAWPASWYATLLLSSVDIIDFLSIPPMTLSVACSNSFTPTDSKLFLAAMMAASLTTLAISAPLKPGVNVDRCLA